MRLGPLEDLPDDECARLRDLAVARRWQPGEWLYRAGDVADRLYVVQSGVVAIQAPGGDAAGVTFALLGEDELFGEVAFLGARRRTAGVVAVSECETVSLSLDAVAAVAQRSVAAVEALMAVMADTIRRLSAQLVEARVDPQPVRLRRLLARLPRLFDSPRAPLTHDRIAQLIGARRTTVSELLATEAAAGRIRTGRGWIEVLDERALRDIAQGTQPTPAPAARR